jgi:phosphatidate cytidylyltransferase
VPQARRELIIRLASSLVLAPLAVAATLAGGLWFLAMLVAALTIAAWEWGRVTGIPEQARALLTLTPAAVLIAYTFLGELDAFGLMLLLTLLSLALASGKRLWAASGTLYLCLPGIACLWLMAAAEDGALVMIWLFACVWATDSCAYLAGRGLGGPKLAPRISPGKTWSGLAGGMLGALGFAVVFGIFLEAGQPLLLGLVAALLALVAQGGDLLKSAVKRRFGVKDFGRLIPGHGGVLDRIDGLMTAAPALAILVAFSGPEQGPPGW